MSKQVINKVVQRLATDPKLNREVENAFKELENFRSELASRVLAKYDLTAEERVALITKDHEALLSLGVKDIILKRADWCTGD